MIKKYKKKDGTTAYMFVAYLGVDPVTRKQKRTTRRGFKTEREAKIAEAKLQTEIQAKGFLNNENITYKQMYELWLEQYKPTVRESSLVKVTNLFKYAILKHFENMPIKEITTPYCQKTINTWAKEYKDYKAIRSYASNVLDYALRLKMLSENPFTLTRIPKKRDINNDDWLMYYTKDELKDFLNLVEDNPLHHALFRTLAFTGVRRGELVALTWNDIDFNKGTISVNKTVSIGVNSKLSIQPPKTKKSNRILSIDDRTLAILKEWRKEQRIISLKFGHNTSNKTQPVFTDLETNKRIRVDYLNKLHSRICQRNNFKKIKIHGFRHTHCSLLFEAGLSIQEVQDRLGHSDIQTTMNVYAHVTENQRDKAAEKFANYISF